MKRKHLDLKRPWNNREFFGSLTESELRLIHAEFLNSNYVQNQILKNHYNRIKNK